VEFEKGLAAHYLAAIDRDEFSADEEITFLGYR
jgi:hypothetical protein